MIEGAKIEFFDKVNFSLSNGMWVKTEQFCDKLSNLIL